MTLTLLLLLTLDSPFVPYIDTDLNVHMNYTGAVTEGEPYIALTRLSDSLSIDSLAQIYPTVVTLGDEQFEELVDNPEEFCERFER